MERDKALEMALGQIEKQFGKGSIMRLGEQAHVGVEAVSTGALSLDLALGIGGLPAPGGRVTGTSPPASPPWPCTRSRASAHGGPCAYIDAEHAMDPSTPRRSASTSTTS